MEECDRGSILLMIPGSRYISQVTQMRLPFAYSFFVLVALLAACTTQEDVTTNTVEVSGVPDQEGWNSTMTTTSRGQIRARITYEHMERYSNKKLTEFDQGVEVELYDRQGRRTSRVLAERATLRDESNDVELMDHVTVKSEEGLTLFTEKLYWNEEEGQIYSEDFVTIVTAEGDTVYGYGFESEQTLENWVIRKPRGVSKKKLRIEALESSEAEQTTVRDDEA